MKINSLKKHKHEYLIHSWQGKALKGTVVNRVFQSLHGESLEIKLSCPLKCNWFVYVHFTTAVLTFIGLFKSAVI